MSKGNRFAGFTGQSVEPEYPAPATAEPEPPPPLPIAAPKRASRAAAAAAAAVATAGKVSFSSYVAFDDHERFARLVESSGKSRVRLLSEALTLLFKHYKC